MKISFTLCSNNYLAQAKVLFDSLKVFAPEHKLVLGLVDVKSKTIDYTSFLEGIKVIEVKEIFIPDLDTIVNKFNIIELNTAVKPFFFKFLFNEFYQADQIIYFDPDIKLFNNINCLSQKLLTSDILITPHVLSPIPLDNRKPAENLFLNYGIYNLGFIAVKRSDNVKRFLDWWGERTYNLGFSRVCEGLFVDQLWINHVPIFFEHVDVLKEAGFNAAPWNLHERFFSINNSGDISVNNSVLYFYHFSSYNPNRMTIPSNIDSYNRFDFETRSDIKPFYNVYHQELLDNNFFSFSTIKCFYTEQRMADIKNKQRLALELLRKRYFIKWLLKTKTPLVIKDLFRKVSIFLS